VLALRLLLLIVGFPFWLGFPICGLSLLWE